MAIIKKPCQYCNKVSDLTSETKLGDQIIRTFECGHTLFIKEIKDSTITEIESLESIDGKKLFPFQVKGVKLALESNVRCLIADEMGLGKTIQGLAPLALRGDDLLPAIILCKSVAKVNWLRETMRWVKKPAQIISDGSEYFFEQFPIHILSYDLWNRLDKKLEKRPDVLAIRDRVKTIILDETHLIKNQDSQRAKAVKLLCSEVEHIIGLSGTPVKNNASELFTILNILKPERFFRYKKFCMQYVKWVWDGKGYKLGGLANPSSFADMTKEYMIRRTMDEVFPEMPKLFRHPAFIELENEVASIYQEAESEFAEFYDENQGSVNFGQNILARMAKLRHITSLAKIDFCIDNVMSFLGSTERKLAIFVHHLDTRDILAEKLNETLKALDLAPVLILPHANPQKSLDDFLENSEQRVVLLSTLAHGESLNMQKMADSILHERQWNPANEDQAISGRFRRINQEAARINCTILVAVGTIDEYFAELVEKKRNYVEETVSGKAVDIPWDETSLMMELASKIAERGRAWKL